MIKQLGIAVVLLFSVFTLQAAGPVDINMADAATLEQLDGIGAVKAQAIIKYRKENGPFKTVDEMTKVSGVGEKTLEAIRPQITVSSAGKVK